jgi:dTDP-4-dehydrorhamnose reductase
MKILILGGNGMLSHRLFLDLKKSHDVKITLRDEPQKYVAHTVFSHENTFYCLDARNFDQLKSTIFQFRPELIINGIGITHDHRDTDHLLTIEVNALLPHKIAEVSKEIGARFIQISTDCVFAGDRGHYTEDDKPDADHLYGRTKLLGEVSLSHCLTLRTSIIGLEIDHQKSLIEWFLSQKGVIKGYDCAIFSGVTTKELSRIIQELIKPRYHDLHGVWHVSSSDISKYQLLMRLADLLGKKDIHIVRDQEFKCNRGLNSTKFKNFTSIHVSSWDFMLDELAQDIRDREKSHNN